MHLLLPNVSSIHFKSIQVPQHTLTKRKTVLLDNAQCPFERYNTEVLHYFLCLKYCVTLTLLTCVEGQRQMEAVLLWFSLKRQGETIS